MKTRPIKKLGEFVAESKVRAGNSDLPVWSVSNNLGFVPSEEYFEKKVASEKTNNYKIVRTNFFAYNPSRINVGSIALNDSSETGIVSPMYIVGFLENDMLSLKYFSLITKSNLFLQQVKHFSVGGVRQILRFNDFKKIEIPAPPLKIQQKIVERLDAIRKAQELNDLQISKTHELFESVLNNFLSKNWDKRALESIAEINPKKEIENLNENSEVSFLSMADISDKAEIVNKQIRTLAIVKKGFTFFKDDDVLFAKITPCMENGKGAFVEDLKNGIGFGSTEFHVIRANQEKALGKYLFFVVNQKDFRKNAKNNMTGSAGQQRVPADYLKNVSIPVPPLKEQQKIVEKLNAVQDYKKSLLKQKELLKELFDSVLHKSMKGKLDGQ